MILFYKLFYQERLLCTQDSTLLRIMSQKLKIFSISYTCIEFDHVDLKLLLCF